MGALKPITYPLGYIDKLCLAGTQAPFSSNAPTWRLWLKGELREDALRQATATLVARWPVLAARVVAHDGSFAEGRRFSWQLDPEPDVNQLFRVLDLRDASANDRVAAEQEVVDRFLDPATHYPFVLTWVRLTNTSSGLFLQQHHGIADGRAFLDLIADLVELIDCAQRGVAPTGVTPFARQRELAVFTARGLSGIYMYGKGALWSAFSGLRDLLLPVHPLRCNTGVDYAGHNRTAFLVLPEDRLGRWRQARDRHGLSVNDLLTGALVVALGRWSARHGFPPGRTRLFTIADTRPRHGAFVSFANHLSSFLLSLRLRATTSVVAAAQQLARQTKWQRRFDIPIAKLLVEARLGLAMPISWLRRIIFVKPRLVANHVFSNLIALAAPGVDTHGRWSGRDFVVESLRVTTPCAPPQGVNTTVVRYGHELCFNFNYKDSAVDTPTANDLVASFEECLAELELELPARE